MPCLQQVVDLQNDPSFRDSGIQLLNIALDPPDAWSADVGSLGITEPLLSDTDARVSKTYGVMRWQMGTGEPGHTFVLVDAEGRIAWIRDYGAPEHGGMMYVPPRDLLPQIMESLA